MGCTKFDTMKKILSLLFITSLLMASCGDDNSSDTENKEDAAEAKKDNEEGEGDDMDFSEMSTVSLDTFGLGMNIMLPKYDGPMNTIMAHRLEEIDEGSRWKITIGQEEKEKFCLFIEDAYGDMMEAQDAGEEVDFIQDKKDELAGFSFKKIDYVVDEGDAILYEVQYEGESVPVHYQVMGVVQDGDNIYKVYSDEGITKFNMRKAKNMLMSIKSMQGKAA